MRVVELVGESLHDTAARALPSTPHLVDDAHSHSHLAKGIGLVMPEANKVNVQPQSQRPPCLLSQHFGSPYGEVFGGAGTLDKPRHSRKARV